MSKQGIFDYYDYDLEIYVNPGCTDCELVVKDACFDIHHAEVVKVAATNEAEAKILAAD